MKKGDLVLVKGCTPDELYNGVMYSDTHGIFKGTETKVIEVSGAKNDKIKLECAPELLFGKDMLVLMSGKSEPMQATPGELAIVSSLSLPSQIVEDMKDWHKKFDNKFTDKKDYREAFRDKLESVLTIKLKGN